jgi:hypothetical protein
MRPICPIAGRLLVVLPLLAALSTALAGTPEIVSFEHKDWALQCDNTRTCRASGYQDEGGDSDPVSMLVSRDAGPGTPVEMKVTVYTETAAPAALQLSVGRKVIRGLTGDPASVPAQEVPELLRQLLNVETATVRAGKQTWTLSLAGVKAVLLKMDEAQGRVGTPGALVRRGRRPESSVLPALPAPSIKAVKPMPARPGDEAIGRRIYAAFPKSEQETISGDCNGGDVSADNVQVFRLDDKTLLISVPCSMGAYNFSSLLWTANDRAPYQPRAVEANGDFDPDTGTVHSSMKGRGIGDCWSMEDWQWDGRDFVRAGSGDSGMCRGFPGGAWLLPSYVTTTQPVGPSK